LAAFHQFFVLALSTALKDFPISFATSAKVIEGLSPSNIVAISDKAEEAADHLELVTLKSTI